MSDKKLWTALGPLLAVVVPLFLFVWLDAAPSIDLQLKLPRGHFYMVSAVSLIAMMLAIAVGVSGHRLRNMKVTFLSLAFISLAEIFAIHGLATPGFLLQASHLPGVAAQLSVALTAFWLWMSSLRSDAASVLKLARFQGRLVPVWAAFLCLSGVAALLFPHVTEWIPVDRNPVKWVLAFLSIIFDSVVIYQYWQSYRFTRFPLQISIVYSAGWLLVAQIIMVLGETWRISWWMYHFLLLAAMVMMLAGIYRQYGTGQNIGTALATLFHFDPAERIEAGISPSVRALIVATESRDPYTAGHNYRVAVFAMKLGEQAGLRPDELRSLAQGAIVHDVGKIQIPDSILNKAGALTMEERQVIERHPVFGYDMCKRLGMVKEELEIIRSHHEKWDGSGYPDGLSGVKIPKLARLLAVVDVYDALTSTRSYRQAWQHADAMRLLEENAGTHFDPDFVRIWSAICRQEQPQSLMPVWSVS